MARSAGGTKRTKKVMRPFIWSGAGTAFLCLLLGIVTLTWQLVAVGIVCCLLAAWPVYWVERDGYLE